jgi:hypothetical protein
MQVQVWRRLTENEGTSQNDSTQLSTKKLADIVNAVYLAMPKFEDADDIVGPRCNGSNSTQDNHTGDNT